MQNKKYTYLIYFIAAVIAATLAIQVYWNFKNYQAGKQQLINEVQASLDNAVNDYYTILAKKNTVGINFENDSSANPFENPKIDSLIRSIDKSSKGFKGLDSIKNGQIDNITVLKASKNDSFFREKKTQNLILNKKYRDSGIQIKNLTRHQSLKLQTDSVPNWKIFASQIIVSIKEDTIETTKMDSLIRQELSRKNLDIDYGILFIAKDSTVQKVNPEIVQPKSLKTSSASKLLPDNSSLDIYFTNISRVILKRNLLGILLSALLVASVIACLLFLLNIIKRQKQLAEVKNDLISNITHEFKTPIATISVALEGIKNFNTENDPVKTGNYVNTSANQLNKLSMMVEKLLETATLDGDDLSLNIEAISLNELLQNLINKHQTLAPQKSFRFQYPENDIILNADLFHLENALNNLLDNAVKYGGEIISVALKSSAQGVLIEVADSGNTLGKTEAKQLFEKFYRVPKGNTHDVKGFGIGLYYTKKIIEKHGGSINVVTAPQTTFKIELPHG
ncbi:sensor histidine kinase [Leeuwenhoekiella nanhaiensis]|uniref:histidine kinase n=1 Tax=Leeuwenhoekiella nanhaiensis TaxID=1655491 RepID=A0A2G1VU57_9FLAO|nr:HAMP domain-containing sensor histidine kinase [Leeuwenhoekiella nanhaiensis]PHQ29979.1 hypothetical protein CJ305_08425 [Leeuwenhoekiella nanhaiensis]